MITFRRLCSARARAVLFDFYLGFAVNPLLTFFCENFAFRRISGSFRGDQGMAYRVWRRVMRQFRPQGEGTSMPLPTLPLRAVLYTVGIYLLVIILMMPIFLARSHRDKLQDIVAEGVFVARLTPEARAFFSAPEPDARAHENR